MVELIESAEQGVVEQAIALGMDLQQQSTGLEKVTLQVSCILNDEQHGKIHLQMLQKWLKISIFVCILLELALMEKLK